MPEWLLQKDSYAPPKEKDTFIDKSILSMLGVLTKLRSQEKSKRNIFGVNAAIKVITGMILILLAALTRNIQFVVVEGVFLLFIVSLLTMEEIKTVFKMGLAACLFSLIVLIPSILNGNTNNGFLIVLKVLISVTAVNIIGCTTPWYELVDALKTFFVPDLFIFVLDITIKYIVIFAEFSLNMLYALKIRCVGRSNNKNTSLSGIMGTLFLKSKTMSEEMYGAMECRGFTGEYRVYRKMKFGIKEILSLGLNGIFIFTFLYFS